MSKAIVGQVYRHLKTSGLYHVICFAQLEETAKQMVVYESLRTNDKWIRPKTEFEDGRFEIIDEDDIELMKLMKEVNK